MVGTVAKRHLLTLTVLGSRLSEGQYGVTDRVEFVDASGNVIVWWASGAQDFTKGETLCVKATVKGHTMFKGVKQTTVSRVARLA